MSNYRYTLSDYHAIKEADITINGITVLAGENGCGKKTQGFHFAETQEEGEKHF